MQVSLEGILAAAFVLALVVLAFWLKRQEGGPPRKE